MKIDLHDLFIIPIEKLGYNKRKFKNALERLLKDQPDIFEFLLAHNDANAIEFLGHGTSQFTWALNSSNVLKLTTNLNVHNSYVISKQYSKICDKLEPVIERYGHFENGDDIIYWVIMERLIPIKNYSPIVQNGLNALIYTTIFHAESFFKDRMLNKACLPHEFDLSDLNRIINIANRTYVNVINEKNIYNDYCSIIKEIKVSTNELHRFIDKITFYVLTNRDSDLHVGNLGLRLSNFDPTFVFFDW